MAKTTTALKLTRYDKNPILGPVPGSSWESAYVTNPGAWYDGEKVSLLYRAGPNTPEHPIYFGLATSKDGYNFTKAQGEPVMGPSADGFDAGCVEDPRIIQFGKTYFVTYAARMFFPGRYWDKSAGLQDFNPPLPPEAPYAARANITRSGLAMTEDFKKWLRCGPITPANVDDRDVIIFPERIDGSFAMLHRPATWVGPEYGCLKPSMWISFSEDLLNWENDHLLARPHYEWESRKIGGSTPPLRTDAG
ncbi:MAG TPA: glycosidase, partial [Kiritimatiellia bacterium]